jgi:UDP-glucose 4-epimerase
VGKNLVARLEADGHEVEKCDLKLSGKDLVYMFRVGDYFNSDLDVIFHLACVNQMQAVDNPRENLEVNALMTREIALRAKMCGAKFVYTSTASAYGQADEIPTPVTAELRPQSDYAVAKLAGEFFVKNSGADWTILRLSNVYGPHQTVDNPYCGVIGRFFDQALKGEPLTIIGDGTQTRDFTYVDDVVDHLVEMHLPEFSERIYNVSHGKEESILELGGHLSRLLGVRRIKPIEERSIDTISRRLLKSNLACPTTLADGLKQTLKWYRSQ